jgi:serine protease Do
VCQSPAPDEPEPNAFEMAIEIGQSRMAKVVGAGAGRVEGYGTGTVVSPNGLIVTSQGVFLDGQSIRVILADGTEHRATVLKRNRQLQLALLKIDHATPDFFELSSAPIGEKGDWVISLNNAFKVADKQEPMSVMLGIIALRTAIDARLTERDVAYRGELILIDAITSNPGAAGGAVLDLTGHLVGIVGKIINSTETNTRLNYAVPSNLVADFVNGKLDQSETADAAPAADADLGIKMLEFGGKRNPAYVDRIVAGGPAETAGVKVDDLVVSLGGEKIGTIRDFQAALDKQTPGVESIIVVKRGLELLRMPITPVPREAK